jgi:RNA polymerase sigma factor (sigma-70 family)
VSDLADDLAASGRGDREAFRRVYHATARQLMAICLSVTRNRDSAEDVLQNVYLKVWRSAPLYDPVRSAPMSWLASVARNAAIDWYRAQQSRVAGDDEGLEAIPCDAEPVDESIMRRQGEAEVNGLVSSLDTASEWYVRRIYLQGMTYREVAEEDGIPLGTLKSRVRRTLITIRTRLGG